MSWKRIGARVHEMRWLLVIAMLLFPVAPQQVHGHFATVTLGPLGSNLAFSATDIKVVPWKPAPSASDAAAKEAAFTCDGKFVPMQ
jgi:polygalacturonase